MVNFHPEKCKVVSINHNPYPLSMLPFVAFHYNLRENLLEYAGNEKDLGVDITSNLSYNGHCDKIISRANQKLKDRIKHWRYNMAVNYLLNHVGHALPEDCQIECTEEGAG